MLHKGEHMKSSCTGERLPRHVRERHCTSLLAVQYDKRFACPVVAYFTAVRDWTLLELVCCTPLSLSHSINVLLVIQHISFLLSNTNQWYPADQPTRSTHNYTKIKCWPKQIIHKPKSTSLRKEIFGVVSEWMRELMLSHPSMIHTTVMRLCQHS